MTSSLPKVKNEITDLFCGFFWLDESTRHSSLRPAQSNFVRLHIRYVMNQSFVCVSNDLAFVTVLLRKRKKKKKKGPQPLSINFFLRAWLVCHSNGNWGIYISEPLSFICYAKEVQHIYYNIIGEGERNKCWDRHDPSSPSNSFICKKTMSSFENAGVYLFFSEDHVTFTGPHRKSRFFKIRLSIVKNFSSFDKGVYSPLSSQPVAEEIYINTRALLLEQKIARWLFGKLSTIQWQDCSPSLVRPVSGFIWRG